MAKHSGSDDAANRGGKRKPQGKERLAARLHNSSQEQSKEYDIEPQDPASIEVPGNPQPSLQDATKQALAANKNYQRIVDKLEKERRELKEERSELEEERSELEAERRKLRTDREPWQEELARRERELEEKRTELTPRTEALEAEARESSELADKLRKEREQLEQTRSEVRSERRNFLTEQAQQIAEFPRELEEHRKRLDGLVDEFRRKLTETASAQEQEHAERLGAWSGELAGQEGELKELRQAVKDEGKRLDARRARIEAELDERLPEEVRRIRLAFEGLRIDREHFERQAEENQRKAQDLEREIQEHVDSGKLIEGMTEPEAMETIRAQRKKIDGLNEELKVRPVPETNKRMSELLLDNQRLYQEVSKVGRVLEERERRLRELEHSVGSEKQWGEEVETFRALNDTYIAQNAELRKALGRDDATVARYFPRLTELDDELEGRPATELPEAPQLDELADRLGAALAAGDENYPELHYSEHDIRSFIAGMAMSRLHILEGDSGTGKTSLAVRAAELLGGHVAKVDVQASWRDSERLLGAYNTFERRFEEEPFTVAVYRAGGPLHSDQVFVVVLDEMNLSSVEYYFADLSPKLEDAVRAGTPIELDLMRSSPPGGEDGWPKRLRHGRVLTVPDNVWFIGTANRDESTHTIADKTYDRAAILELQRGEHDSRRVSDGSVESGSQVGFRSLRRRFEEAQQLHDVREMTKLWSVLDLVDDLLKDPFFVRWSPRFEDHVRKFVPVYVACGGEVADAADQLLATKVLRRLRDRYGNKKADLDKLRDELSAAWEEFRGDAQPQRSRKVLEVASRRAMT